MQSSFGTKVRKLAVGFAMVGLLGGATAAPAFADHNSGNGNKNGHDNGNGKAKGHDKQDARNSDDGPTPQEVCEANGGSWELVTTVGELYSVVQPVCVYEL